MTQQGKHAGTAKAMRLRATRRLAPIVPAVALILPLALLLLLGLAAAAEAAPKPRRPAVHTGAAEGVSFGSATLTGSLDPRGQAGYYYFQYGPTSAYGQQTALEEAGSGTTAVKVSAAIAGLSPLTIYHYRLVAVNGTGTSLGAGRVLKTSAVPLSLAIVASPNPVAFGGTIVIQGTLSGTGAANREVVLEGSTSAVSTFAVVGNPELTTAAGGFSFVVAGADLSTFYRVSTTTSPAVLSPVVGEGVSVVVRQRHSPVKGRRHRVRVSGTVTPAENGMHIGVLRQDNGRQKLAGGAVLKPDGAGRSRFSVEIRRRTGVYRVFVAITTGTQASTSGAPFLIR